MEKEQTDSCKPSNKSEKDEKDKKDKREGEAAVLPMDGPSTVSALIADCMETPELAKASALTSASLPTLTLSVIQSNLKQPLPSTSTQTSVAAEKKENKEVTSTTCESKVISSQGKKVAPIFPSFSQTLDPKYIPGNTTVGIFGKTKEKHWKVNLFSGLGKTQQKKEQSQTSSHLGLDKKDKKLKATEGNE